ncbi:hypothetical protein CJF30_00010993 [Rutstroemia sp. NJR-2017a BBW]|nr:hypothetical protein CJF30_00010993 [Rutstroemia sp. NJR-2017a BBW]
MVDLQQYESENTTRLSVQRLTEAWRDQVEHTERGLGDIGKERESDEGYSEDRRNHEKRLGDEDGTIETNQKHHHCDSEQNSAAIITNQTRYTGPANTYRQQQLILARTMQAIGL